MDVECLVVQLCQSKLADGMLRPLLTNLGDRLEQRRLRIDNRARDYYSQVVGNLILYPQAYPHAPEFRPFQEYLNGIDEGTGLQRQILLARAFADLKAEPAEGRILLPTLNSSAQELFVHDGYVSFTGSNPESVDLPADPRNAGIAVRLNTDSQIVQSRNPFTDQRRNDDVTAVMISTVLAQSHLEQLAKLSADGEVPGMPMTRSQFWTREWQLGSDARVCYHDCLQEITPYAPRTY